MTQEQNKTIQPIVIEATFRVRYAETDAMRVVYHANYIIYFEHSRSEYIRQRGASYAELERAGNYLAVSEVQARYIRPAYYDDLLTVRCWLAEVRSRTLTFEYGIINAGSGETLVTGYSKHICLNHEGKVTKIPTGWQSWLTT